LERLIASSALLRDQNADAEKILLGAVDKYPQAADLHSFLGYAYKRMGRIVDARKAFESAYKLKSRAREHYLQWIKMEIAEKEYSKAIAAAEKALRLIPDFPEAMERRVYAERQAGFDFHAGLHREKAERLWRDALQHAEAALKSPELLRAGERQINASLYCSIVRCLDMLREYKKRDEWVDCWASEHPDDPELQRQCEFLARKYGNFFSA
jgi:tetratricopeptide (TPR) repeat protein